MKRLLWLVPLAVLAVPTAVALDGCLAYNEDCAPLIDEPDAVVGYLDGDVDITKVRVRSGDNVIGQLAADAYRHSADGVGGTDPADIGFENSGAIRNEGVCENNDTVSRGPVRKKTLRQVLPFDDTVSLVTISVATLKQVLEHSVSGFTPASAGAPSGVPPGSFLQISGVTADVDCAKPAQTSSAAGARVTRIVLADGAEPDGGAVGTVLYDAASGMPPSTTQTVRIAINSYVFSGGDGYTMLENLDPTQAKRYDNQGLNFQIVAQYFQKTYPQSHPLSATAEQRWVFHQCAGTVGP